MGLVFPLLSQACLCVLLWLVEVGCAVHQWYPATGPHLSTEALGLCDLFSRPSVARFQCTVLCATPSSHQSVHGTEIQGGP